ncbi:hypothetical protein STCU_12269 [Strigomonas culicis]|uniref:Uncharacterized protein n=1 Tax=Strigomonas culicis TaxID=28005 RepID=S9TE16_9TRYP|nr:hypothetical protein STCU_12269 [Strigomonas culicis]|eukprot:EPY15194.1 hypothetical protein STCU_12269 [Strigomonas culicis]
MPSNRPAFPSTSGRTLHLAHTSAARRGRGRSQDAAARLVGPQLRVQLPDRRVLSADECVCFLHLAARVGELLL